MSAHVVARGDALLDLRVEFDLTDHQMSQPAHKVVDLIEKKIREEVVNTIEEYVDLGRISVTIEREDS